MLKCFTFSLFSLFAVIIGVAVFVVGGGGGGVDSVVSWFLPTVPNCGMLPATLSCIDCHCKTDSCAFFSLSCYVDNCTGAFIFASTNDISELMTLS